MGANGFSGLQCYLGIGVFVFDQTFSTPARGRINVLCRNSRTFVGPISAGGVGCGNLCHVTGPEPGARSTRGTRRSVGLITLHGPTAPGRAQTPRLGPARLGVKPPPPLPHPISTRPFVPTLKAGSPRFGGAGRGVGNHRQPRSPILDFRPLKNFAGGKVPPQKNFFLAFSPFSSPRRGPNGSRIVVVPTDSDAACPKSLDVSSRFSGRRILPT